MLGRDNYTALYFAAANIHYDTCIIEELLYNNADVNALHRDENAPFHLEARG